MIHLVYSNHTEELLAALVDAIRSERAGRSPFDPLHLVVPNRNIETYVKHGIAEALGVAANLEITFLQRLAERLARDVAPGARLCDARQIEGHLLGLLHDEAFLGAPVLAPVREYLLGAGARPDTIDRRRSGLAAEVARLFDEYGASRPELLQAWRERATLTDDPLYGDIEAWQRALWLGIFGPRGRLEQQVAAARATDGAPVARPLTLADLGRALESQPGRPGGQESGAPLHVFGVSYIARAYHQVLLALGRGRAVHLYTLNPCREFWEDVESAPELRQRLRREGRKADFPSRGGRQPELTLGEDPYGLESANENLALRLWGRPGRENIRLLNDRTGGDFTGRFVANVRPGRKATLLARLQDDILDRTASPEPDPADARLGSDGSLQVMPCPGVRRELEVIAAEIWRAVDSDPTLRLNQIAVVVPESVKDAYLAHVGAVFAEAHQLPHAVVDLPFGGPSRLGEALLMLLELPFGSFTRRELLPLCTHPAVIARYPDARPTEWLHLAEDLGIVHGADHADHAGTYIERDVLNWDQGVRRLALGAFMDPVAQDRDDGPAAPVVLQGQAYLPLDRSSDERASALDFCLLVRSLIADARFALGATGPRLRPLAEWCDFVRGLCAAYLTPVGSDDEALLGRCLTEIETLETMPLGSTPVSFRIAADLIKRALSAQSGGRGQYLAHGVTVTSFVPMRAVPFRIVFVAGLGERAFPSGTRRSELDLRGARRAAGDVTPRQRDLYMFLETLLSARDRLVLSYVARDELTGSPLSPSSIVRELREIVASGYLGAAATEALFAGPARPPLRRYDDPARASLSLLATQEAQAKALGQSLRAALPPGTALPDLGALRRGLPASTFQALGARLSAHEPPDRARRGQGAARLVVPLEALRRFLEDPLQGSARFRLRMREVEGDEELLDREDEPFETDRLQRAVLLRQAMWEGIFHPAGGAGSLPTEAQLAVCLRRWARLGELQGVGPTGLFGAAEAPTQIAVLSGWLAELRQLAGAGALAPSLIRFGRPTAGAGPAAIELPALTLDIPAPAGLGSDVLPIEIVGRSELQVGEAENLGSLVFAARRDNAPSRIFRDRLRAFVDHVVLAAAGRGQATPRATHVVWSYGDRHTTTSARFAPLAAADAQAYLGRLIGDLVAGASTAAGWASGLHPYLLPCEAVFAAHSNGTPIVDEVEKLRDYYLEMAWKSFSTVNGPVPQAVERHDPPPAEEAERMAQDRFGLYWQLLDDPTPPKKAWGGQE